MSTTPPPGIHPVEIGRLDIERHVLGRLDDAERAALVERAARDPELAARIEKVEAEIGAASVDLPPLDLSMEPSSEGGPPPRANRPMGLMVGALLAVAAAIGLVVLLPGGTGPETADEVFRGSAFDLEVVRVRQGQPASQGVLIEAREGDRLQYTVTPLGDGWLTVVDVQDDGSVSLWMTPQEVRAGEAMDGAVVLDGYAGKERVYFLVADAPVERDAVEASVRSVFERPLADLDALPGIDATQRSLLIVKAAD